MKRPKSKLLQPCSCGRAAKGRYSAEQCAYCWSILNFGRESELLTEPAAEITLEPSTSTFATCPELGPALLPDELQRLAQRISLDLAACGCAAKVRHCALHDFCTTGEERPGLKCCATCDDHPSRLAAAGHSG